MTFFSARRKPDLLPAIMLLGLVLRAAFVLVGPAAYYRVDTPYYLNGDSGSYMLAFENLLRTGHYTFNFLAPDAAYGRLPGYPFFYGLHRLLFGAALAPAATIWSQALLDTAAIVLVFKIMHRVAPERPAAAGLGALLYAAYPFITVWVPVIGSEVLSTDLTLLWFYSLLARRPGAAHALGVGALLALSLLVREYMGILLPITLLWVLATNRTEGRRLSRTVRRAALVAAGFGLLYAGWPLRNYALSGRLIWLKPPAAGYLNQTPDVDEFYQWVHCWAADENPWLDSVVVGRGPVAFPAAAFGSAAEAAQSQRLVALARRCGSGFYAIRSDQPAALGFEHAAALRADTVFRRYQSRNCNAAIAAGFAQLRQRFVARQPLRFWLDVPLQNLRKAFFKNSLVTSLVTPRATPRFPGLPELLFVYRSLLLLLGWGGLLLGLGQHRALWLVLATAGFQYFYICFLYRGLEMRYLLQVDVLLLLPAALLLDRGVGLLRRAVRPVRGALRAPAAGAG